MTAPSDPTLEAVLRIVRVLDGLGIRTAIIGAWALAFHGFDRVTEDVDLATSVAVWPDLRRANDALVEAGLEVEFVTPDPSDPLGGLLNIRAPGADLIQVVNYLNPWTGSSGLAAEAIETAQVGASGLRYVDIPHLIALKLYAHGEKGLVDSLELLKRHPEVNLDELRAVCERRELAEEWATFLEFMRAGHEP